MPYVTWKNYLIPCKVNYNAHTVIRLLPKLPTQCILQQQSWDFAGIVLPLKISKTILLLFSSVK